MVVRPFALDVLLWTSDTTIPATSIANKEDTSKKKKTKKKRAFTWGGGDGKGESKDEDNCRGYGPTVLLPRWHLQQASHQIDRWGK
mmetsp:Transcript_9652/g.16620  ORF Transcript_9652/g.16620 Transcript_9652/m.16620 type:complete len:86 (-) Transcript_9652:11-268(-)